MTDSQILYNTVIKNGYCIGCGACASIDNSPFKIKMDEFGNFIAYSSEEEMASSEVKLLEVCPFSGESKNEDELGEIIFPDNPNRNNKLGKYIACYAGFVNDGEFRAKGSSGGMGKWLGYILLQENEIDYFIQLVPNNSKNSSKPLFDYKIFSKNDDIITGSKSAYYPSTLTEVLDKINIIEGRYAITGVPCFIKALRLLANESPVLKERIKYTIGIVCGGMKSANQAKMIGWQLGVHPNDLTAIDFRRKYSDRPASQKIYQVWSKNDNIERFENANNLFGTDYGSGFFKPLACDFCDDVVAETADISFGDAWIPRYRNDPKGTSLIIVRNEKLLNLLKINNENKSLYLDEITINEAITSQAGGFRHRRDALSYRIEKKEAVVEWYPSKRVKANDYQLSKSRKKIYDLREEIASQSHSSFLRAIKKDDLNLFYTEMNPLVKKYKIANDGSLPNQLLTKLRGRLIRMVNVLKGSIV